MTLLLSALAATLLSAPAATTGSPACNPAPMDALWSRRDNPQVTAQIAALSDQLAKTSDYECLWRVARWDTWLALGSDRDHKRVIAKQGWDVGERAKQLKPGGLEGLYWTAISLGTWGSTVSAFEALRAGIESKYRDPLLAVVAADPRFQNPGTERVGPLVALGHFYYKMPWPKQDKGKAKRLLEQAIAAQPENLRAHLLYADSLKDDDRATARKELQLVLAGAEDYDPPDARRNKAWARQMLDKLK